MLCWRTSTLDRRLQKSRLPVSPLTVTHQRRSEPRQPKDDVLNGATGLNHLLGCLPESLDVPHYECAFFVRVQLFGLASRKLKHTTSLLGSGSASWRPTQGPRNLGPHSRVAMAIFAPALTEARPGPSGNQWGALVSSSESRSASSVHALWEWTGLAHGATSH